MQHVPRILPVLRRITEGKPDEVKTCIQSETQIRMSFNDAG